MAVDRNLPHKGFSAIIAILGGVIALSIIAHFSESAAFVVALGIIAFAVISMVLALRRK